MTCVLWRGWVRTVNGVPMKGPTGCFMAFNGPSLPKQYRDGWQRVVLLPEESVHLIGSAEARRMAHRRARALSPARRRAIARLAANARWKKKRRRTRA